MGCEKLEIEIPNTVKIVGNNTINGTKTDILKKKAEEEEKRKVENEIKKCIEGGTPLLGKYYQSDNFTKEPIEWVVLAREGNKALLISKYALECKEFNETNVDTTWESCTLRKWLNEEFIDCVFNTAEKSKILMTTLNNPNNPTFGTKGGNSTSDKIFLLSIEETEKYFLSERERICKMSVRAKKQAAVIAGVDASKLDNLHEWWLRSPGYGQYDASYVDDDGDIYCRGNDVYNSDYAVRPAFWLNLES